MELAGATALVTGGRGGLGSQACRAFLAAGCRVMAADIVPVDQGRIVEGVEQVQADVSTAEGAESMVHAAMKSFGRIGVLVNNAAVSQRVAFSDLDSLTEEFWARILAVDLTGPFICSKAVAPIMRRQERGRIVNTASTSGMTPSGSSIAYAVAKAGLIHLTRCLAVALAPYVLVTAVSPALMEGTGLSSKLGQDFIEQAKRSSPLGRGSAIEAVADMMVTLARSESITGTVVNVDAGFTML